MKNIMKLVAVIFVVGILSNSLFAQEVQTAKNVKKAQVQQSNWVDANGDGICDNGTGTAQGTQNKKMNKGANKGTGQGQALGNGHGDGSGQRPQDGTGFGKKNGSGTGNSDGTQTSRKGSGRRGGK